MYCTHCGVPVQGNFCAACGTRISTGLPGTVPAPPPEVVEAEIAWEDDVRYEAVVRQPGVRTLVDRHAASAKAGLSAENFLALCDAVMPLPVSLEKLATAAMPIYERLGYAVKKQRAEPVAAPVGRVMLRLLCSLARHGRKLRSVKQSEDGCQFEAELPSNLLTMQGQITITLRRDAAHTQVAAATKVPGQLYDWGKSKQVLDELFTDLRLDPA